MSATSPPGKPRIAVMGSETKRAGWAERATARSPRPATGVAGVRSAIVDLLDEQPCALSAVEIGDALARRGRGASRAQRLPRDGGARADRPAGSGSRSARGSSAMSRCGEGSGHHHHLVCERCGRLEPFTDDGLERAIQRLSERLPLRGLRARDRDPRRLPLLRGLAGRRDGPPARWPRRGQSPLRLGGIGCPGGGGSSSSSFGTVTRS